jgi:OOP family OmpA-OmpF porin
LLPSAPKFPWKSDPLVLTVRRLSSTTLALLAFLLAAAFMVSVAFAAALVIETRTGKVVSARLADASIEWITVDTDGLQVVLTGTAPNEAVRFRAVNMVGSLIDSSRIRDQLDVTPASAVQAPDFSVKMLRTEDGIQLIGLMPDIPAEGGMSKEALVDAATLLTPDTELANFLETATYPAPSTWEPALALGLQALGMLERSKVSVEAKVVEITAVSDSDAEKKAFEDDLRALAPPGVRLILDISAPRPVITPFTMRFVVDGEGARFDSCSADTERARSMILAAGARAGVAGNPVCTVGLGTPTPRWADAVVRAIGAVAEIGSGSVTFSDSDVTFLAGADVSQAAFDKVVGELETGLPDAFSLTSSQEKAASTPQGPAEFTATLSEDDKVELRGRLTDTAQRSAVDAFARAAFEGAEVLTATRIDETLPDGWPVRVLAGLAALAEVEHGSLLVRADLVEVTGVTGSLETRRKITQILSGELGQGQTFRVNVRYDEALDPIASLPTPEECAADVNVVITRTKIIFTPASAELATTARPVLDALAAILIKCPPMQMEIGGHTDSQGSEDGNKKLSQDRAEAVLLALQGRRVDTSGMTSVGYGEATPIADNETEEGREANRRIAFVLQGAPPQAELGGAGGEARLEGTTDADLAAAPADAIAADTEGAAGADASAKPADGTPELAEDTSPSVAPVEKTIRPLPRPEGLKAGDTE